MIWSSPWRSGRLGGFKLVSNRRFFSRISYISRFKIIPYFLASLFNFLIGFRIPLCVFTHLLFHCGFQPVSAADPSLIVRLLLLIGIEKAGAEKRMQITVGFSGFAC